MKKIVGFILDVSNNWGLLFKMEWVVRNLISLILMLVSSVSVFAATQVDNTKISELFLSNKHGEFVFIRLENPAPRSSCSKNGTWDYTLPLNTEFNKAMYSTILSVYMAGKTATVVGNVGGLCNETGTVESMESIRLH